VIFLKHPYLLFILVFKF
jgi:hypothetical protein